MRSQSAPRSSLVSREAGFVTYPIEAYPTVGEQIVDIRMWADPHERARGGYQMGSTSVGDGVTPCRGDESRERGASSTRLCCSVVPVARSCFCSVYTNEKNSGENMAKGSFSSENNFVRAVSARRDRGDRVRRLMLA